MSKLKEQNGKYYREAEVVMITTDKFTLTTLCKCIRVNGLLMDALKLNRLSKPLSEEELEDANHGKDVIGIDRYFEAQNLYILSDDEIKVGDYVVETLTTGELEVFKIDTLNDIHNNGTQRKIIATTDESLRTNYKENNHQPLSKYNYILPKPSDSFISKYIKKYNQGNQIKKMLVEYCQIKYEPIFASMEKATDVQLKIDSGNVITLKK